jgi:hypothetical protein
MNVSLREAVKAVAPQWKNCCDLMFDRSPLFYLLYHPHPHYHEIGMMLVENGFDIHQKDKCGHSVVSWNVLLFLHALRMHVVGFTIGLVNLILVAILYSKETESTNIVLKILQQELVTDNKQPVEYKGEVLENIQMIEDKEVDLATIQQNIIYNQQLDEYTDLIEPVGGLIQQDEYISEELKKDKEVVLAAVKQDGYALQYASEELKKDKEVVLAAVKQNGYALKYASEELKKDKEFMP